MTSAVLADLNLTLIDWAKRVDPSGKIGAIAELLNLQMPMLDDMVVMEGNLPTGHMFIQRTSLPTVYGRLFNQGVANSKSTTAQITVTTSMYEARSEVDVAVARINGDTAAFRLSEAAAFIQAMQQKISDVLLNGNHTVTPSDFDGLKSIYASTTGVTADNIVLGEPASSTTTGACSSIYFVGWANGKIYTIFPKGSMAGLGHFELDDDYVEDADGLKFFAHRDRWTWDLALVAQDPRFGGRIANIDITRLEAAAGSATPLTNCANLVNSMIELLHRIPTLEGIKGCWYMNRIHLKALHFQCNEIGKYLLTTETVEGKQRTSFLNFPIRLSDKLGITEAELA
jgi:hypothetical protein